MTFDDVAGSVLTEYAERRDELEERHERDDLVSSRPPSVSSDQRTREGFVVVLTTLYSSQRGGPTFSFPRPRRQISYGCSSRDRKAP
jgi:hypothetical protein